MALAKITKVTGKGVPVPGDDIDTDRIIPARFMKCVTFDGLGDYVFYDVRKNEDGSERKHPLNEARYKEATILITGNNFGCGSSREHAPQALYRAGFRAVIGEGFAEIFFGNSTQMGMPCVHCSSENLDILRAAVDADPGMDITIDLEAGEIGFEHGVIPCGIREGARNALMNGKWDPLEDLLNAEEMVEAVAENLPYMAGK